MNQKCTEVRYAIAKELSCLHEKKDCPVSCFRKYIKITVLVFIKQINYPACMMKVYVILYFE